jgi:hypothetical protein
LEILTLFGWFDTAGQIPKGCVMRSDEFRVRSYHESRYTLRAVHKAGPASLLWRLPRKHDLGRAISCIPSTRPKNSR